MSRKPTPATAFATDRTQAKGLASRVREGASQPASEGATSVVLVGAKGGVGASTVTISLARGLAASGVSAVAIDAHLGRGDLALVAGWRGDTTPGIDALIAGAVTPSCVRQLEPGVQLIPGQRGRAPAISDLALAARLALQGAAMLAPPTAWRLFDAGDAFGSWSAELAQSIGRVLLVTTPEPLSVLTAYAALKHLRRVAPRAAVAMVVNRCEDPARAEAVHRCVAQAAERFAAPIAPLAGWSPTGANIEGAAAPRVEALELARRLLGASMSQPQPRAAIAA